MSLVRADFLRSVVLASPASCRFVGPDEFVAMALAAYYAASRDLEPPEGEPWAYTGDDVSGVAYWAGPEDFLAGLLHHVDQRLHGMAIDRGYAVEFEPFAECGFEAMAHGCAAGDLGAGAPPVSSHGTDATAHEEPLFVASEWQELPDGASFDDTETNRGAIA